MVGIPSKIKAFGAGLVMFCVVLLSSIEKSAAQTDYVIDNDHTSIIFSVSHYKIGYLYGRFNKCTGLVAIDRFDPSICEFRFKIKSDSIDTNNSDRDIALRGNQFFDSNTYPTIEFFSTAVTEKDGTYFAEGQLKIKEVTKDVMLPFKLTGSGPGPLGKTRVGMLCKFVVKRSDYGITEMLTNIGDDIAITFSLQAIRK